jgi:hypothetical protein
MNELYLLVPIYNAQQVFKIIMIIFYKEIYTYVADQWSVKILFKATPQMWIIVNIK